MNLGGAVQRTQRRTAMIAKEIEFALPFQSTPTSLPDDVVGSNPGENTG